MDNKEVFIFEKSTTVRICHFPQQPVYMTLAKPTLAEVIRQSEIDLPEELKYNHERHWLIQSSGTGRRKERLFVYDVAKKIWVDRKSRHETQYQSLDDIPVTDGDAILIVPPIRAGM